MRTTLLVTSIIIMLISCNRPASIETAESAVASTLEGTTNYADSLAGRWLLLSQQQPQKYIHYKWNEDPNENSIVIEKDGTDYVMKIYMDDGEPDVLKIKSVDRIYAGTILNKMEYNVACTNLSTKEELEMLFTPVDNSINRYITVVGYFQLEPGEYRYFVKDDQKSLYEVVKADLTNAD